MSTTVEVSIWEALLGVETRFVDAEGVRTRIVDYGEGEVLVLLHGTGGHVETWAHNIRVLGASHRVIAIDLVGHGLTDKPDLEYVLPDYSAHVRTVLDVLGVDAAHFAGVSLGAWVASWLALETPERVLSIVNATGAVFRWAEGQEPKEVGERQNMVATSASLEHLDADSVRRRLQLLFHDPAACTEELVRIRLAIYSRPGAAEVLPRLHHMIPYDAPDRIRYSLTIERLEALNVPVLYLWGEFNPGGSLAGARRAAAITPHGEFEVIEGVGHWPQWEAAEEFNRRVADFLERATVVTVR